MVRTLFAILFGLVTLAAIVMTFTYVSDINQEVSEVELRNFENSLSAVMDTQNSRTVGSSVNVSIAIPNGIIEMCFFEPEDAQTSVPPQWLFPRFRLEEDNNLFIKTTDDFKLLRVDNVELISNPTCIKNEANVLRMSVKKISTGVSIDATDVAGRCIKVLDNGDPSNKIDIVFMGYGFDDTSTFNSQINRYVNNILFSFEPFDVHKDSFNVYRIDDAKVNCKVGDFIQCNEYEIMKAALVCPNDHVVLLVSRSAVVDFIRPVRSSAVGNIIKLNTADKPFVLMHEFGHTFADLADEYVDNNYYGRISSFDPTEYVNCDSTPCESWGGLVNTGCYKGCSLSNYYRPTENSIMRSLSYDFYGPVNGNEILRRLEFYE